MSLVEIEEKPHEHNVNLSVEVIEPEITDDHTAKIRLSFENTGNSESPPIEREQQKLYKISSMVGDDRSERGGIMLYATDISWRQPTRSDGCWETQERGGPGDGGAGGGEPHTLAPGETLTREFRIWDTRPDTPCLPPGEYWFANHAINEDLPFDWSFTLAIERTG